MFEGLKVVKSLKRLVKNTSNIPNSLVTENEHLAKQKLYTPEEVAVMIIQTVLHMNYILREDLTNKGEQLVSEVEKAEAKLDY